MKLTLYQSAHNPIAKKFRDGKLTHPSTLKNGRATRAEIKDIIELQEMIDGANSHNALGFGIHSHKEASVPISYKGAPNQYMERTKENFKYRDCSGFLLIDYDPNDKSLRRDELLEIYTQALPELADAPVLWKTSSSSCINDSPITGQHFIVAVSQMLDIPRLNNLLFKRLWLLGFGYIFVDKAGRMHPRTIMDKAVNSPERLCFIKADVIDPDKQDIQTKIYNNSKDPIDSSKIPDLSTREETEYSALVEKAKEDAKPESDKQTDKWVEKQIEKKKLSREQILKMRDDEILYQAFEVMLEDGTKISVKELLDDPDTYHGQRCYDPFEPEYQDYFNKVAYLDLVSVAPRIFSHAHGGRNYNLEVAIQSKVEIEITNTSDKLTNHEWPSSFVGELAREIWERMAWPNKEIAIISARHIIRSLIGRKASFESIPMTQINILLARQGVGKDTANKALNEIIEQLIAETSNDLLKCYRGSKGTYGVKAFHIKLMHAPSMSIIIPEAGIASKSTTGDVFKVKQYLMQNIAKSAYQPYDISDYADALPDVYGPTLSILEESTQTSYIHNFTIDSVHSGDEARKLHHFVDHKPNCMPTNLAHAPYSSRIINKLKLLIMEANRGEDFDYTPNEESKFDGPSLKVVNTENYVLFKCTPEARALLDQRIKDEFAMRSRDDVPESEWTLAVRCTAQIKSESLLYAYVDKILNKKPSLITIEHMEEAQAYVEECKRSMECNMGVVDTQDSRLVQAILEFMIAKLGSKNYYKKHSKREHSYSLFKHSFIVFGTNPVTSIAAAMESPSKNKNRCIQEAYIEGQNAGHWRVVKGNDEEIKNTMGVDFRGQYLQLLVK